MNSTGNPEDDIEARKERKAQKKALEQKAKERELMRGLDFVNEVKIKMKSERILTLPEKIIKLFEDTLEFFTPLKGPIVDIKANHIKSI